MYLGKVVLRASSDCLLSPNTLVRWGYSLCKKCPLCSSSTCNAHHILSVCPTALQDGRYTWRHDQVLSKLAHFTRESKPAAKVFADLPNQRACEAPVSTDLTITIARPDIILIEDKTVTILELTVPWNSASSLVNARSTKENKPNYQLLTSDLSAQALGYSALFLTNEIGCPGNHTNDAYTTLKAIAPKSTAAQRRRTLLEASKAAITGSYRLHFCCQESNNMAAIITIYP